MLAGYQISYEEQKIISLSPKECVEQKDEGLYSVFVINESAGHIENAQINKKSSVKKQSGKITMGVPDCEFIRGKVPMTKEEIRTVSISKLNLNYDSIVYDIGSGTGSVAVEIAMLSEKISVYAIEKNPEALELIGANSEKFYCDNICRVEGSAPEVLNDLPAPTHAFIGGSSGKILDIVKVLINKNPKVRIVANAVSLETLKELIMLENELPIDDFEVVTLNVSKTHAVGSYHMMKAENPVYICSFRGRIEM